MRVLAMILLLALAPAADAQARRSAKPDARLGAGGIARSGGNVVFPGTPTGASQLGAGSPGLPVIQTSPRPNAPQPAPPEHTAPSAHYPVYLPFYVPVYGIEDGAALITGPPPIAESAAEHKVEDSSSGDRVVSARPDDEPEDYGLIALDGGLIYAASKYRVEGQTLRFVTVQGDQYVVALHEVDVEFSKRLNRERGSEFSLEVSRR